MNERILSGRYKLQEKIGHGGMSTVYKAEDLALKRIVALKIMNSALSQNDEFIQRFSWEAKATSRLSHRNIVKMYDAGNDQQTYYLVMEYVPGTTLKDRIKQEGAIPIHEAISITIQLCEALTHAHENEIIHRDIKPQNVMGKKNSQYKIMDFGISRIVSSDSNLTKTGNVMGSVHYFSPEQAQGQKIDVTSDLYSLGVVLYEMLTGHLPYDAAEEIAVALKHIQEAVPNPQKINPAIPDQLVEIVMKAMAKKPADRFSSAEEMKESLQSIHTSTIAPISDQQSETTIPHIHQPRSEKYSAKQKKPNRLIWSITSIIAIALLTFFGYPYVEAAFLQSSKSSKQQQENETPQKNNTANETTENNMNETIVPIETNLPKERTEKKQINVETNKKEEEKPEEKSSIKFETKYLVSIGSFEEEDNARDLMRKLKQKGIQAEIKKSKVFGKTMFRVHAGIFSTSREAEQQLQTVKNAGIEETTNATIIPIEQKNK